MLTRKEDNEEFAYSPLDLLYSAYANDRLCASLIVEEGIRDLEKDLSLLPQRTQEALMQTFCKIYAENEQAAFLSGLRVGVRLAEELKG